MDESNHFASATNHAPVAVRAVHDPVTVNALPHLKLCEVLHRVKGGRIEGIVMYDGGKPVKGATAKAFPLDRGLAAKVPSADTDEFGHFKINHLWPGKFYVSAKKRRRGLSRSKSGFLQ